MGKLFPFAIVFGLVLAACSYFGPPATAAIMALLACVVGGLATGIASMAYFTGRRGVHHNKAFNRGLYTGLPVTVLVLTVWTLLARTFGASAAMPATIIHASMCVALLSASAGTVAFGICLWLFNRNKGQPAPTGSST